MKFRKSRPAYSAAAAHAGSAWAEKELVRDFCNESCRDDSRVLRAHPAS